MSILGTVLYHFKSLYSTYNLICKLIASFSYRVLIIYFLSYTSSSSPWMNHMKKRIYHLILQVRPTKIQISVVTLYGCTNHRSNCHNSMFIFTWKQIDIKKWMIIKRSLLHYLFSIVIYFRFMQHCMGMCILKKYWRTMFNTTFHDTIIDNKRFSTNNHVSVQLN